MLDFKKMIKKSDFQYERDTVTMFLRFLATREVSLSVFVDEDNELFRLNPEEIDKLTERFIHECVKR